MLRYFSILLAIFILAACTAATKEPSNSASHNEPSNTDCDGTKRKLQACDPSVNDAAAQRICDAASTACQTCIQEANCSELRTSNFRCTAACGANGHEKPDTTPSGDYGKACTSDLGCADKCILQPNATEGYCSKACGNSTECPVHKSFYCDTAPDGSGNFCLER